MLVNDRKESPVKANRCIFQAKIKISSENNDFIFVERNCVNLTLRFPYTHHFTLLHIPKASTNPTSLPSSSSGTDHSRMERMEMASSRSR